MISSLRNRRNRRILTSPLVVTKAMPSTQGEACRDYAV
jgi:hypothetical protein